MAFRGPATVCSSVEWRLARNKTAAVKPERDARICLMEKREKKKKNSFYSFLLSLFSSFYFLVVVVTEVVFSLRLGSDIIIKEKKDWRQVAIVGGGGGGRSFSLAAAAGIIYRDMHTLAREKERQRWTAKRHTICFYGSLLLMAVATSSGGTTIDQVSLSLTCKRPAANVTLPPPIRRDVSSIVLISFLLPFESRSERNERKTKWICSRLLHFYGKRTVYIEEPSSTQDTQKVPRNVSTHSIIISMFHPWRLLIIKRRRKKKERRNRKAKKKCE